MSLFDLIVKSPNKKVLRDLQDQAENVSAFEDSIKKLSDEELRAKTAQFREMIERERKKGLSDANIATQLLSEAFAVMREAMRRVWNERHFDVQVMGGIVLHQGKIAEMKTGEGKTIVAALPLYLNALFGRGAHLVTVNDYLSRRDGEGMGDVYHFLGLSTGIIQSNFQTFKFAKNVDYGHYSEAEGKNLEPCSRTEAYACDITYGTNNEFGFDYLRDNMIFRLPDASQRELYYAIVDEVDSILIDEARTPLIISAQAEESTSLYQQFAALVPRLNPGEDYSVDEKDRVVTLTDSGIQKMEKMLGVKNIYEGDGIALVHHLEEALKAHALFKRDKDYVVKDGEIVIVDEFTGRLMVGRRYSEGLHQAIEAKEGVEVKQESQTLATISFQNFFRMYKKLAGMTGTAATEAEEFFKIYKLDVVEIPTNRPVTRKDSTDRIYKTSEAKWNAIVADIKICQEQGQPVLVGTVSVEKNEMLSKLLKRAGVKHEVLNAKHHDREAKIVAKAGEFGAVTVATNMAGRGTDIKIGKEIKEIGGLHVIGTERHEARRIDNQLRGRAGRQGDPGSSQFYVSLEDDLMRIFGGDRIKSLMNSLGLPDEMPIENRMISKSIESAQRKVEGHNFDIRKHLVEYDDVMNKHREVIYRKRREILEAEGGKRKIEIDNDEAFDAEDEQTTLREEILSIISDEVRLVLESVEDEEAAKKELSAIFGTSDLPLNEEKLIEISERMYDERERKFSPESMREIEKAVYLRTIDMLWVQHLTTMDELRTGIGLRGYGQRDPLVEYKQESYRLFQQLLKSIELSVARTIFKVEVRIEAAPMTAKPLQYEKPDLDEIGGVEDEVLEIEEKTEEARGRPHYAEASRGEKGDPSRRGRVEAEGGSESQHEAPNNTRSNDSGGVTTTVRYGGKTVYERMKESSGGQVATVRGKEKVGRNDPCPCGSGKKFKKCHGK
ncbi:MAG: preprotein translocase subunit SecA [Patescibacteria group bacterium]|jgi:preprotein translocase subunit SecA